MYVTSPTTTDAECRPNEYDATESVCSGAFNLDLSTNDVISVSFKAPEGEELEISAAEKVRFEFQATVENCGEFQEFSGSDVTVSLIGSDTSGLVVASESFLTLGKCDGCASCEIFTGIRFNGPVEKARLSDLTLTVSYDKNKVIEGVHTYTYGTAGYMWINADSVTTITGPPPTMAPVAVAGSPVAVTGSPTSPAATTTIHGVVALLLICSAFIF